MSDDLIVRSKPNLPFAKEDLGLPSKRLRILAALVDVLITVAPVLLWYILNRTENVILYTAIVWGLLYWLFRDVRGRSIGKMLTGLRVVVESTGEMPGWWRSFIRNLPTLFLLLLFRAPYLLLVAIVLEPGIAFWRKDGKRIGDRLAGTRVEGS